MNNDIINLQETSANNWQAKYRGNYGIYNIKIKVDGKKMTSFSCSCPSDYHPCKHIPIIKAAIDKHISENKNEPKENTITVEEVLTKVPHKELIDFVVRQAKYDTVFTNTILLEFIHKSPEKQENNYALILRKALSKIHFDYEDLYEYHDDCIEIGILDEWLEKAKDYISQKRYDEAIAICKACIEEYAEWMQDIERDIIEYIDLNYQEKPFELLEEIISTNTVNSDELFKYCSSEMSKKKYERTEMYDGFNNLILELAHSENNATEFIALQDNLLKKIDNKSSYEAEKIISRKIEFYKKKNQPEKAWQLITENIQIVSFRKQVVEQQIADKNFKEAKKLITEFLDSHQNGSFFNHSKWNEFQLSIAQKEKDIPTIRKVSFAFFENNFQAQYYRIYKSSFTADEWKTELQNLIQLYEKKDKYFSSSIADIFAEEKDATSLLKYIEKHHYIGHVDKYYSHFLNEYPKETLDLFQKSINQYAEKNTGREYYEYIATLFKKIAKIEGGYGMVTNMINQYKIQYKNRRAMIEILNKIKL